MRAQWKSALSTIVFSVPSPVRALHYANIAINTLLLIFVTEFLAVPYFDNASGVVYTRVGALSPDAAKIVVRHPPTTNATENLVRVSWRQVNTNAPIDAPWRPGPVANLTAETDWVQTVRLSSLWPSTTYECRLPSVPASPSRVHSLKQTASRMPTKVPTVPFSPTPLNPSTSAPSPTLASTQVTTSASLLHLA